jgi:23S rRNA (cytosine1962-C5)-methyltransferase
MAYPILTLKPGSEIHLRNRHHAIFQSAVVSPPQVESGGIVEVRASDKSFLCYATYNPTAYICGRAVSFEQGDPLQALRAQLEKSIALRKAFFENEDTNAYRLVNAEGDFIPGLIVDQYGDVVVLQSTTLGMDVLRDFIVEALMEIVKPKAIYEKSTSTSRKKEGIEDIEQWIRGDLKDMHPDSLTEDGKLIVRERGIHYVIDLVGSQKTGLFLDQREMRSIVKQFAKDRTVLDCCSYVGGFALNALVGGAKAADAVDYDKEAISRASKNIEINGIDLSCFGSYAEDVFVFLRRRPLPRAYDFIILDPPAFAKRSSDIEQAKKAYTDMNRSAMMALPPGSLLLTCSCSYHVDIQLFQTIVFHAARQAKRNVRILQRHHQAYDHPVNLYHPEADYLKSLLLWVE